MNGYIQFILKQSELDDNHSTKQSEVDDNNSAKESEVDDDEI